MRTTMNIDEQLLSKAQRVSGLTGKTALVREGLKALLFRAAQRSGAGNLCNCWVYSVICQKPRGLKMMRYCSSPSNNV